jgi:hypothetical protein
MCRAGPADVVAALQDAAMATAASKMRTGACSNPKRTRQFKAHKCEIQKKRVESWPMASNRGPVGTFISGRSSNSTPAMLRGQ